MRDLFRVPLKYNLLTMICYSTQIRTRHFLLLKRDNGPQSNIYFKTWNNRESLKKINHTVVM
jgi:hypothetical protein